jgi:intracellular sulfur oxidation DsrE/DsrF family protein
MTVTPVEAYVNATTTKAVSVERIVLRLAGVPAWMMKRSPKRRKIASCAKQGVVVHVCKRGCGTKLYKDWYGELVCPVCGYHEYEDE